MVKRTVGRGCCSIILAVLVVILTPIAYLAWRAAQPMKTQEFNGLTFNQFMAWKKKIYAQDAQKYDRAHPTHRPVDGECYEVDMAIVPLQGLLSGFYTLAGIYPDLQKFIRPEDIREGAVTQRVTWFSFLPVWWKNFEFEIWWGEKGRAYRIAYWCDLPEYIPPSADQ